MIYFRKFWGYKNDYRDNVGNFEYREGCKILGIYMIVGKN